MQGPGLPTCGYFRIRQRLKSNNVPVKEKTNMKNHNKTIVFSKVLFIIYLITLFWILLFKLGVYFSYLGISRSVNLIPFIEVFIQNSKIDFGGMIMNVVICKHSVNHVF